MSESLQGHHEDDDDASKTLTAPLFRNKTQRVYYVLPNNAENSWRW